MPIEILVYTAIALKLALTALPIEHRSSKEDDDGGSLVVKTSLPSSVGFSEL